MRAEFVAFTHFGIAAGAATVANGVARFIDERGGDNAGRNGDDGVAQKHDETAEQTAQESDRRDVAVTHCAQSGDGPVDAGTDVGEGRAWLTAFNDEHDGAETASEDEHEQEIDGDLVQASSYSSEQQMPFVDEDEGPENAEDTKEAYTT